MLVTTLDADNRPHPKYFSNLTYHYLMEFNRQQRSYQPVPFFTTTFGMCQCGLGLVALASSFGNWNNRRKWILCVIFPHTRKAWTRLSQPIFGRGIRLMKTYQQFWRSYFAFNSHHKVIPLFIPVYQDAVQNKTYF